MVLHSESSKIRLTSHGIFVAERAVFTFFTASSKFSSISGFPSSLSSIPKVNILDE